MKDGNGQEVHEGDEIWQESGDDVLLRWRVVFVDEYGMAELALLSTAFYSDLGDFFLRRRAGAVRVEAAETEPTFVSELVGPTDKEQQVTAKQMPTNGRAGRYGARPRGICPKCEKERAIGPNGICMDCQHQVNLGEGDQPISDPPSPLTLKQVTQRVARPPGQKTCACGNPMGDTSKTCRECWAKSVQNEHEQVEPSVEAHYHYRCKGCGHEWEQTKKGDRCPKCRELLVRKCDRCGLSKQLVYFDEDSPTCSGCEDA